MDEKEIEVKLRKYMYETKEEAEINHYTRSWVHWIFGAITFCEGQGLIGKESTKRLMEEYRKIRDEAE